MPQYSLAQAEKESLLVDGLDELHVHHRRESAVYARVTQALFPGFERASRIADFPWIPVGMFKSHRLISIPEDQVFKTLTSSGTTGAAVSRVYLDRETARLQAEALASIMTTTKRRKR